MFAHRCSTHVAAAAAMANLYQDNGLAFGNAQTVDTAHMIGFALKSNRLDRAGNWTCKQVASRGRRALQLCKLK